MGWKNPNELFGQSIFLKYLLKLCTYCTWEKENITQSRRVIQDFFAFSKQKGKKKQKKTHKTPIVLNVI